MSTLVEPVAVYSNSMVVEVPDTVAVPALIVKVPGELPGERIRLPPRARVEPALKSMVPLPLRV